jgi:SAM-dependent methyltransferase
MPETAFRDDQFDLAYPEGISGDFWTLARNEVVKRRVLEGSIQSPVVLDVGCGRGITVEFLRKAGLECYGAELGDPPLVTGIDDFVFRRADAFDLPIEFRSRVDTILLLDVVEHLPAPAEFLAGCRRRFPRLSRIVVTVPARRELWSNYDDFYGHLTRFDRPSLLRLLGTLAGRSVATGYFFHLLYPALRVRLLFGRRPVALRSPRRLRLHHLVARAFSLEEKLAPRGWVGTSLWGRVDLQPADGSG